MSAVTITLPESLDAKARALAESEQVSLEQLIVLALAEKMSALLTEEYLGKRAKRASKERFEQAMARVPDVEPDEPDRL